MTTLENILKDPAVAGAYWNLTNPEDMSPAESTFTIGGYSEAVFEPDNRTPVDETDYADGGKYRSIVKIVMRYEGQTKDDKRWAIGIGYLISPNVFVTAGHCVYDRTGGGGAQQSGLGRVVQMKCYIGYCGLDSVARPNSTVQARRALSTVTTAQWVTTGDRRYDVAFVKVDRPFEGRVRAHDSGSTLRNFVIQETPMREKGALLGVVGYPGDKYLNKEKGAQMYELFETVDYDLAKGAGNMLQYRISTFKGQSGAPVIRKWDAAPDKGQLVVIGTHCYGGEARNSASVIGGEYGNNYNFFISALEQLPPAVKDVTAVKREGSHNESGETGTEAGMDGPTGEAEGFLDVLKSIGRVVAPVVQTALPLVSPLLGPLGGPVSAIGSVAMGALSKAVQESDMESGLPPPPRIKLAAGVAERAVVAESVLQTVLRMERSPVSQRIVDKMRAKYTATGFTSKHAAKLGPRMVPLLSQAGLRVAVTEGLINKPAEFGASKPVPVSQTEADLTGDTHTDKFLESIAKTEAKVLKSGTQSEAFFDNLGPFLMRALKVASPVLLTSARAGLQKIDQILAKKEKQVGGGTEALLEDPTNDKVITDEKAAALLAHRAVVAECALQAVLEAEPKDLRESVILGESAGSAEQESFFGGLLKTVQRIAPAVLKAAPAVLNTAVPVLLGALGGASGGPAVASFGVSSFEIPAETLNGEDHAVGANGWEDKKIALNGDRFKVRRISLSDVA
ncbi:hypothetical protein QBC40DRAFT_300960 [Triangularia verruculosa]|uniref:Serine protease n=1 Tax=Triangularia verruculosa TaxID=2587418 RepID=A0AAN6XDC0_9PEZI|nr:hypothetical protein QBC40DRAFT_300960 [Triangularia verruculosa]